MIAQRIRILLGLILALVVPNLGLTKHLPHVARLDPYYVIETVWWVLFAILIAWVMLVEKKPLASLGLRKPDWRTLVWGIGAGLVLALGTAALYLGLFPIFLLEMKLNDPGHIMQMPWWFRFLLVLRVAIVDETFFRGYGITRLEGLARNRWIAGAITLAAFLFSHWDGTGIVQFAVVAWAGMGLTALYLWRRDLACNIIACFVLEGAGYLLR